jgi:hypothetical protein
VNVLLMVAWTVASCGCRTLFNKDEIFYRDQYAKEIGEIILSSVARKRDVIPWQYRIKTSVSNLTYSEYVRCFWLRKKRRRCLENKYKPAILITRAPLE